LYDLRVVAAPRESVRAWKPAVPGVTEVFHARFVEHAYPAHVHDDWTLFIVDEGAIRYDLDRHEQGSDAPLVTVLPPHVAHDGRPAQHSGYRKRVLYIAPGVIGEEHVGHAVDRPTICDQTLRASLSAVHHLAVHRDDSLEAEMRLAFVVERVREHLSAEPLRPAERTSTSDLAEQMRALLDADLSSPPTLDAAACLLGANATHLVRCFTAAFGVAPHAYLQGKRIEVARRRLLDGQPAGDVAVAVGFYDQSHFTRMFRRYVGSTPFRYATSGRQHLHR